MKPRTQHPLESEQATQLRQAERLCWWTVAVLVVSSVMMFAVMGNSQAMKIAWIEDVLSLVPPIAFLVAARFSRRAPDETYINGRQRGFDIAYLIAAVALTGVGLYLLYDSLYSLISLEHPSIGGQVIWGHYLWAGWLMIGALLLTTIGPVIIGRIKVKLAKQLHLKALHTDADMNKADWMTAVAGAVGIAGVGMGWWWADAAAALFISADVLHDGLNNLRHASRDLHDAYPETVERARRDPLVTRIQNQVGELEWVDRCEVRLHEEGPRLSGLILVKPVDRRNVAARLAQAYEVARTAHWRVDEIAVAMDEDESGEQDDEGKRSWCRGPERG